MMLPLKAVNEYPPKENTADALGEVEALDGLRYHVKADQGGRRVRASEWLCTKIAEEIGIAGPHPSLIQMLDGRLLFGSRRIGGVADPIVTRAFLTTPSQSNLQSPVAGLQRILSVVYAYDMFIFNVDRHFGNYLSHEDSGARRLYAMDYSRALFWSWPLVGFPLRHENTRECGIIIRKFHGFDCASALSALDQIERLAPGVVEGFINRMPADWLPSGLRADFLGWWSGSGRTDRLKNLRTGLENGQLL